MSRRGVRAWAASTRRSPSRRSVISHANGNRHQGRRSRGQPSNVTLQRHRAAVHARTRTAGSSARTRPAVRRRDSRHVEPDLPRRPGQGQRRRVPVRRRPTAAASTRTRASRTTATRCSSTAAPTTARRSPGSASSRPPICTGARSRVYQIADDRLRTTTRMPLEAVLHDLIGKPLLASARRHAGRPLGAVDHRGRLRGGRRHDRGGGAPHGPDAAVRLPADASTRTRRSSAPGSQTRRPTSRRTSTRACAAGR